MASNYYLKLKQFEGPLDLLIHLIKVNEIDIFNIDIFLLTNQYIKYLRLLNYDDLSDAGEFVEMAATLIEIKSRMLLPRDEKSEEKDELDEDDPRKTLQEQLIQHEQYRLVAEYLGQLPQVGSEILTNSEFKRLEPFYEDIEGPLIGDSASLVILYEQMLRHLSERKPVAKVEAKTHRVSIDQKLKEITDIIQTVKFALFQGFYSKYESRYEFVVNILAVLELARWGKLKIYQQEINGPIWIYAADLDEKYLPISTLGDSRDAVSEANQRLLE